MTTPLIPCRRRLLLLVVMLVCAAQAQPAKESATPLTLAEYAELLGRKARQEATGDSSAAPAVAKPVPAEPTPRRQRAAAAPPPQPFEGWRYIGAARRQDGSAIFAELLMPAGQRVTVYPGDVVATRYVVRSISPQAVELACRVAPAPATTAANSAAASAAQAACQQSITRS